MNNYDLRVLDDKEFEALAVDLVGVLHGCRIERFKPGKDAGVDGRWFITEDQEAIVQCKHWMRTGYDLLCLDPALEDHHVVGQDSQSHVAFSAGRGFSGQGIALIALDH